MIKPGPKYHGLSMIGALELQSGDFFALTRHAAAAILSAADPGNNVWMAMIPDGKYLYSADASLNEGEISETKDSPFPGAVQHFLSI